jgi:predicted ABC-type sugar transport system permease subunit
VKRDWEHSSWRIGSPPSSRRPKNQLRLLLSGLGHPAVLAAIRGRFRPSPTNWAAQPNIGLFFTFPVFAAVIIGGASLSGGEGTVTGAMSGALLLVELQQGSALLTPGPHVQQLFPGFVTISAVALAVVGALFARDDAHQRALAGVALTNIRKRRA